MIFNWHTSCRILENSQVLNLVYKYEFGILGVDRSIPYWHFDLKRKVQ